MTLALGVVVLVLAGVGGWRLRVLSQDVAVLDRDLGRLHEAVGRARHERAELMRQTEIRHRRTEAATSQTQNELIALRQRVDGIEPWVALWATADDRQ